MRDRAWDWSSTGNITKPSSRFTQIYYLKNDEDDSATKCDFEPVGYFGFQRPSPCTVTNMNQGPKKQSLQINWYVELLILKLTGTENDICGRPTDSFVSSLQGHKILSAGRIIWEVWLKEDISFCLCSSGVFNDCVIVKCRVQSYVLRGGWHRNIEVGQKLSDRQACPNIIILWRFPCTLSQYLCIYVVFWAGFSQLATLKERERMLSSVYFFQVWSKTCSSNMGRHWIAALNYIVFFIGEFELDPSNTLHNFNTKLK